MKRVVAILLMLCVVPSTALAFRYNTHTWIAQTVINDVVDDGYITIQAGERTIAVAVRPELVQALSQYPEAFRLGNIGPDAFPDIVAGQMTAHPGLADGWKTDDWLSWMLSGAPTSGNLEDLAFAYGYAGHAATDIWAHSYVNQFAGDVFWIADGEQEVEDRHIALERYMDTRLPPITDASGAVVSLNSLLTLPSNRLASALRDRLIFNDSVEAQYGNGDAYSYHLYAVNQLRKKVIDARAKLESLENWGWDAVNSMWEAQSIWDTSLTRIDDLNQRLQQVLDATNGAQLYSNTNGLLWSLNNYIQFQGLDVPLFSQLQTEIQAEFDQSFLDGLNNLNNYLSQLTSTNKFKVLVPKTCWKYGFPYPCTEWKNLSDFLGKTIAEANARASCTAIRVAFPLLQNCDITSAWNTLQRNITNANNVISDTITNVHDNLNLQLVVEQVIAGLEEQRTSALQALGAFTDVPLDFNDFFTIYLGVLQNLPTASTAIRHWESDINSGMREWIKMSGKQLMQGARADGGDMLTPLDEWLSCWGPSIAGIPSPIPQIGCEIEGHLQQIEELILRVQDRFIGRFPLGDEFLELRDRILQELEDLQIQLGNELIEYASGVNVQRLIELNQGLMTEARLNEIFASDDSFKGLHNFSDMSQRINSEMKLDADTGQFDPAVYHPIFNAVVMAKLALLDAAGLDNLAGQLNARESQLYGGLLYDPSDSNTPRNILIGAVRNMDGNHQWNPVAPPYPRQTPDNTMPQYGYFLNEGNGGKGLRIYEDPNARATIFNKIFKGPVALALHTPGELNPPLPEVIAADYPFRACELNPFPRTVSDVDHVTYLTEDFTCRDVGSPPDDRGVSVNIDDLANGILLANEPIQYVPAGTAVTMNTGLVVPEGVTLILEEGTELYFKYMKYLDVYGTLEIRGSADNKVILGAASGTYGCAWMGIRVNNTSIDTHIDHAKIQYGCEGTSFKGASGTVTNSEYFMNYKGISVYSGSSPNIENNLINTNGYGLYINGNNNAAENPSPIITHNAIIDNYYNSVYAIAFGNGNSNTVDARGNYWGTTDTTLIDSKIYDGRDISTSPIVDYSNYLSSAP